MYSGLVVTRGGSTVRKTMIMSVCLSVSEKKMRSDGVMTEKMQLRSFAIS